MKKVFILSQLQSEYDVAIALQLAHLAQALSQSITVIVTYAAREKLVADLTKSSAVNKVLQLGLAKHDPTVASSICSVIAAEDFILLAANNLYAQKILPSCCASLDCLYIENVHKIDKSLHYAVSHKGLSASCSMPKAPYAMTIDASCLEQSEVSELEPQSLGEVVSHMDYGRDIILVGGRALGSAENFKRLEQLAELMGADIGATAGAVAAGYAPDRLLVGVSGSDVADKVYIGFGVSGAISHTLALGESKTIIAINHDSNAAILAVADYAVIIDVMTAIEYFENIFSMIKE